MLKSSDDNRPKFSLANFRFHSRQANASDDACENSVQGRDVLVDDKGRCVINHFDCDRLLFMTFLGPFGFRNIDLVLHINRNCQFLPGLVFTGFIILIYAAK